MREVKRRLHDVDAVAAYHVLQDELTQVREGHAEREPTSISFDCFGSAET
jgi:hypothetical protein